MTFYDVTVFYKDGTKEEYVGEARVDSAAQKLKIYTQHEGMICIPFSSIKKYTIKG